MGVYYFFVKKDALKKAGVDPKDLDNNGPLYVSSVLKKLPKGSCRVFLSSETGMPDYKGFVSNPKYVKITASGN